MQSYEVFFIVCGYYMNIVFTKFIAFSEPYFHQFSFLFIEKC
jgi:hypothetical protein